MSSGRDSCICLGGVVGTKGWIQSLLRFFSAQWFYDKYFLSCISYIMPLTHVSINSHVGVWNWTGSRRRRPRLQKHEHSVKFRSSDFHLNSGFVNHQISWLSSIHNKLAATTSPTPRDQPQVRQGGRRLIKEVYRHVKTFRNGNHLGLLRGRVFNGHQQVLRGQWPGRETPWGL